MCLELFLTYFQSLDMFYGQRENLVIGWSLSMAGTLAPVSGISHHHSFLAAPASDPIPAATGRARRNMVGADSQQEPQGSGPALSSIF